MKSTQFFSVGVVACTAMVLSACSAGQNAGSTLPGSPAAHVVRPGYTLGGNATRYYSPQSRLMASLHATPDKKKTAKDFYITTTSTDVLVYSNKSYEETGTITDGITLSDGDWVDSKGNLYVANATSNVVEYESGATSPTCTYTGAADPINVTTDSKGNVYVVDFEAGAVDEFAQCGSSIVKKFSAASVEGAAVDKSGDLFVAYSGGSLEEFKDGSTSGTPLGASVGEAAGLIIDKSGNLIADDQSGSILVIAPPYTNATTLVSGLEDPFHCALNKKENLLFNADAGSGDVTVYSYPSGTLKETVSSGAAEGVAESPDAVF